MLSPEIGTTFANDYRIVDRLGVGGMGAVYVVEQLSTGKRRALKVMLPGLVTEPSQRKRFEQEARVGSLIASKHVVEVHAAGVEPGSNTPWLVMELLSGETLDARVQRVGPLSPKAVREIFEQLAHALSAAHAAGIVHRDLKPENLFLAKSELSDSHEILKVLDFGIAKLTSEAGSKTTDAMGSPLWMAPEQTERRGVQASTDVWAMGLIAYFLLTGRPFWKTGNDEGGSVGQVMREILFEPIPSADERAKEQGCTLPAGFAGWFARCLTRDPSSRFPTAAEAWKELEPRLGDGTSVLNKAVVVTPPSAFDETMEALRVATTEPVVVAPQAPASSRSSPPRRRVVVIGLPLIGLLGVAAVAIKGGPFAPGRLANGDAPAITTSVALADAAPHEVPASVPEVALPLDAGSAHDAGSASASASSSAAPSTSASAPRAPSGPSLAMVRLSTTGSPSARKTMLSAVPRLEACFRKSRAAASGKGMVELTIALDEGGKPTSVTTGGFINQDPGDVMPCFKEVMQGLAFTPVPGETALACTAMLYPAGALY